MSSAFDKSGGINVYGDKVFTGNVVIDGTLTDGNGSAYVPGGGSGGLGTVYKTSSTNNSPINLNIGTLTSGQIWVGDVFIGAKTTYLTSAQSQIWVGVVGNIGSAVAGSITVNGTLYPISTDPNTWAAGILSSESATLQSFTVDFINNGNDAQLTITAKPGANVATVSNLNFTGPSVTNSLNVTQTGSNGVSSTAIASIKLSNCFYSSGSSNLANSGSFSIITDSSNILQNITASVSNNNLISVTLTGLNGYTINWAAYAVGQKVLP